MSRFEVVCQTCTDELKNDWAATGTTLRCLVGPNGLEFICSKHGTQYVLRTDPIVSRQPR